MNVYVVMVKTKNDLEFDFEEIKDDDIENNYKALFVSEDEETGEKSETSVELVIVDDTLTINYDDGSQVVLKEKK